MRAFRFNRSVLALAGALLGASIGASCVIDLGDPPCQTRADCEATEICDTEFRCRVPDGGGGDLPDGGDPPMTDGGDAGMPPMTDGGDGGMPPMTDGGDGGMPPMLDGGDGGMPPMPDGGDGGMPPMPDGGMDGGGPIGPDGARPDAMIVTPSGDLRGRIDLELTLIDVDSRSIDIVAEFSVDGGNMFAPMTLVSEVGSATRGLAASAEGVAHTLIWESVADTDKLPIGAAVVRITPRDGPDRRWDGTVAQTNVFSINNTARMIASTTFPAGDGESRAVAVGNLDDDEDLDVVIAGDGPEQLVLNAGEGFFFDIPGAFGFDRSRTLGITLADVDNDRHLDVLFAEGGPEGGTGAADRLFLNDGLGSFRDASAGLPEVEGVTVAILAGDLNNDRRLDLITLGAAGTPNLLMYGDGDGGFTLAEEGVLPGEPSDDVVAGALGDFDRDDDLDLVYATPAGTRLALNNDGVFELTVGRIDPLAGGTLTSLLVDDFNGDQLVDLVQVVSGAPTTLLRNEGQARFQPPRLVPARRRILNAVGAAAADYDLNGTVDVFIVTTGDQADMLTRNDGQGTFAESSRSIFTDETSGDGAAVVAFDADGDSDPDFLVVNRNGDDAVLWINE